jgi:hypothetical protein
VSRPTFRPYGEQARYAVTIHGYPLHA